MLTKPKVLILIFLTVLGFTFLPKVLAQTPLTISFRVGETVLTLEGKTSPNSQVTFIENSAVVGTTASDSSGDFSKDIISEQAGLRAISYYATDVNNDTTQTVTLSVSVPEKSSVTVSSIIIPPTINLSATTVSQDETLTISGTGVPNSAVTLFFFDSTTSRNVTSSENGSWTLTLNGSIFAGGTHRVYAILTTADSYQSENSEIKSFIIEGEGDDGDEDDGDEDEDAGEQVTTTPSITSIICGLPNFISKFDFNENCKFDLIKEFILGAKEWVELWKGETLECDLSLDGRCNLVDFSIVLYYVDRQK